MEKRESIGIGTGSVSILAVFVVLCLTTLSVLSLVSARADNALTQKTAQVTAQYYEADAQAEKKLAALLDVVKTGYGWENYAIQEGFDVFLKGGATTVAFSTPITESKELYAEVELVTDDVGAVTGEWNRTVWQTRVLADEYIIDESMEVF
ncbi:MAG TPA: hypothetical protein DEB31_03730 [Clostridiales bacterium]|nr:hypothetical protein [Clostridiales bacterium]